MLKYTSKAEMARHLHSIPLPRLVCGIDEVGRGSLAGPITAAAVVFDCSEKPIPGIQDSKSFANRDQRRKVYEEILECPYMVAYAISNVSAEEIDRCGLEAANQRVFETALRALDVTPEYMIVDGTHPVPNWPKKKQLVRPKADQVYWQVSAASIIAKESRDEEMRKLAELFPGYGFDTNAGYGTRPHIEAIRRLGLTSYHRMCFTKKMAVNH